MNNIREIFLSENFQFLEVKLPIYLNRRVFVMRSLMRIFTGLILDCQGCKISSCGQEDTDQTTRMSSLGANHIKSFF